MYRIGGATPQLVRRRAPVSPRTGGALRPLPLRDRRRLTPPPAGGDGERREPDARAQSHARPREKRPSPRWPTCWQEAATGSATSRWREATAAAERHGGMWSRRSQRSGRCHTEARAPSRPREARPLRRWDRRRPGGERRRRQWSATERHGGRRSRRRHLRRELLRLVLEPRALRLLGRLRRRRRRLCCLRELHRAPSRAAPRARLAARPRASPSPRAPCTRSNTRSELSAPALARAAWTGAASGRRFQL